MNTKTLIILGAVAGAAYLLWKKGQPGGGWNKSIPITTSPVPGIAAGELRAFDMGGGNVLDPRGIPIGATLNDGSIWTGVTVQDTSKYAGPTGPNDV